MLDMQLFSQQYIGGEWSLDEFATLKWISVNFG